MSIAGKTYYPRMLSISGGNKNVGKTTLACELIKKFSKEYTVSSIKISSHFHQVDYLDPMKEKPGKYMIYREEDPYRIKDSSRMLSSGAVFAFYIQGKTDYLPEAFHQCYDIIPSDHLIICESGHITRHIEPGLSFFIGNNHKNSLQHNSENLIHISKDTSFFSSVLDQIYFSNNQWQYKGR